MIFAFGRSTVEKPELGGVLIFLKNCLSTCYLLPYEYRRMRIQEAMTLSTLLCMSNVYVTFCRALLTAAAR